jgi:phospholipid-binding lipoprotein MlaA
MTPRQLTVCFAASLALSACATRPPASDKDATEEYEQTNDPLEPTNRALYNFSDKLDKYTLKPVSEGYTAVVPSPVRNGLHNAFGNLSTPVTLVDDITQGNGKRAAATFWRFAINTTLGGLGLVDVAKQLGVPAHDTDFGITLALWGVPSGPYLFLPFLGPSSPRAAVGYGADIAANPFTFAPRDHGLLTFNAARGAVSAVDERARFAGDLDHIKAGALDPYATFRSLYRQNLESQIKAAQEDRTGVTVPGGGQPGNPAPAKP